MATAAGHGTDTATLSSDGDYTLFSFGGQRLRFRAPSSLERYTDVREWDHGYLVAGAKYRQNDDVIEEYIDLAPVLQMLGMDEDAFLDPIKTVEVRYAS